MKKLQQERLVVAVGAQAAAEQVLADTIAYTQERKAFGKPIGEVPEHAVQAGRVRDQGRGRPRVPRPAGRGAPARRVPRQGVLDGQAVADRDAGARSSTTCLQFFGGYGYMLEYPITRAYMDARVQRIFAGTNEIMKVIIAKQLGL